jgi:Uma2 family endonuclease
VKNLESFRRWYLSDDFPDSGVISYIQKEVWLDLKMEELAHNQVKGEIAFVLTGLLKKNQLGKYFQDRFRLINWQAGLSTEPDGMFVLYETLQNDQAKLVEGEKGWMELEGTPDMVLEVVSASSVKKDTVKLRKSYWQAEIPEYWLVDPRPDRVSFEILRSNSRGYVPARKSAIRNSHCWFDKSGLRVTSLAASHSLSQFRVIFPPNPNLESPSGRR